MLTLILPLSVVLGLLSYSLIAKWYVMPALGALPRTQALTPLLLLHTFRFVGLAFLIPGVTSEVLDPRIAQQAAYGDLLAAVLALVAIMALRSRWAMAIPLVWIFNIEGSLDLLSALFQALPQIPDSRLGATFFIVAVLVPALLVTHYMIFVLLLRRDNGVES